MTFLRFYCFKIWEATILTVSITHHLFLMITLCLQTLGFHFLFAKNLYFQSHLKLLNLMFNDNQLRFDYALEKKNYCSTEEVQSFRLCTRVAFLSISYLLERLYYLMIFYFECFDLDHSLTCYGYGFDFDILSNFLNKMALASPNEVAFIYCLIHSLLHDVLNSFDLLQR